MATLTPAHVVVVVICAEVVIVVVAMVMDRMRMPQFSTLNPYGFVPRKETRGQQKKEFIEERDQE